VERFIPRLVEVTGGLIIADCKGDGIQLIEGDAWLEVGAGIGQGFELDILLR
jgi:hypothetical protein